MTIEMNKLREIARRATPGKWEGWTSNSVTRITAGCGVDGGVLHATMARREYAELACSDADRAHIAAACPAQILALPDQFEALQHEKARLSALANTPQLHDFAKAVVLEAGQPARTPGIRSRRWQRAADWFWVLGYLGGKALRATTATRPKPCIARSQPPRSPQTGMPQFSVKRPCGPASIRLSMVSATAGDEVMG